MGYDYADRHRIWIVDVSEPVFYQASYVASDLLPWKVPQFVPVQESESSAMAEEGAQTTEGKQLSPTDEKAAGQRPSGKGSGRRSGPTPAEPAASKGTKQPASPKSTRTIIE